MSHSSRKRNSLAVGKTMGPLSSHRLDDEDKVWYVTSFTAIVPEIMLALTIVGAVFFIVAFAITTMYTIISHMAERHQHCRLSTVVTLVLAIPAFLAATWPYPHELASFMMPVQTLFFVIIVAALPLVPLSMLYTKKDEEHAGNLEKERDKRRLTPEYVTSPHGMPAVNQQLSLSSHDPDLQDSEEFGIEPAEDSRSNVIPTAKGIVALSASSGQHGAYLQQTSRTPSLNVETPSASTQSKQQTRQQNQNPRDADTRKGRNIISVKEFVRYLDYDKMRIVTKRAKKFLRQGVMVDNKMVTDKIAYLRLQDWILLYRMRTSRMMKKKPPLRQLRRLKSLDLIREEGDAIYLTRRGRTVAQAFWLAVKPMMEELGQGNSDADD